MKAANREEWNKAVRNLGPGSVVVVMGCGVMTVDSSEFHPDHFNGVCLVTGTTWFHGKDVYGRPCTWQDVHVTKIVKSVPKA